MGNYVAKWPNDDGYIEFTDQEHRAWQQLYDRQIDIIRHRAHPSFIEGIEALNISQDKVPQLKDINSSLTPTGWTLVPVGGTVGVTEFFTLLSNRQFPAANFIRVPEELNYLSQPDIFHEIFGHAPLLLNPCYASFVQWYGQTGLSLSQNGRSILGRLFWYTIEFGLTETSDGLRIYGGGILSSYQETQYALDSKIPLRHKLDIKKILSTPYDYTKIQPHYFILESLEQLFEIQNHPDLLDFVDSVAKENYQPPFNIC